MALTLGMSGGTSATGGSAGMERITTEPADNTYLTNKLYVLDWSAGGSKTILLGAATSGIKNEYSIFFDTGSTAPSITWPSGVTWKDGAPSISASKHYEVSVCEGYGVCVEFDLSE